MKKTQVKLPILLPEVPGENDRCVQRLMDHLQNREGIEKVHIASGKDDDTPQLCFHYDPDIISITDIRKLAKQAGAALTNEFGHTLLEVEGIRHARHARKIQNALRELEEVMEASVSESGIIRLEYSKAKTNEEDFRQILRSEGLKIKTAKKKEKAPPEMAETSEHSHEEAELKDEGHAHDHGGILGRNTEMYFSIICGVLLGTGFGLSYFEPAPEWVSLALYIGAYFFGGYYTAKEAIETVAKGGFEIDFLMLVAAIGAAILGEWAEGALLLFLFSLGHSLEYYAMGRAREAMKSLAELDPKPALRKTKAG